MRRVRLKVFTLMLLGVTTASAGSVLGVVPRIKTRQVSGKTVIGYISDSSCGLQHMAGMSDKDCTLMCAKNGKFVLADRERKLVYQLDKTGQGKASEFAGQKVRVKGRIVGRTILVTAIEVVT